LWNCIARRYFGASPDRRRAGRGEIGEPLTSPPFEMVAYQTHPMGLRVSGQRCTADFRLSTG